MAQPSGIIVNDLHSQLNATRVHHIVEPETLDAVRNALSAERREHRAVCIAGSRHAMGAQAFATDGVLVDIRKLNRVLAFDTESGLMEVESGMQWPQLLSELTSTQLGSARQWAFSQKQTGADRLTIGGCLSANVHGRGDRGDCLFEVPPHDLPKRHACKRSYLQKNKLTTIAAEEVQCET